MADYKDDDDALLVDYDDEDNNPTEDAPVVKQAGGYVGIHTSGFKDFLLKPELLRAIVDCGFEAPSQVQHECIPQAILGMDVICQAKSGMGKTAVFVLSTLQLLEPVDGECHVLAMCHTRDLAFQIKHEYDRFCKYMKDVRSEVFYGGVPVKNDEKKLKTAGAFPHIVVGTPGRIKDLANPERPGGRLLDLSKVKHFVLDECDKMLDSLNMRQDVQTIFRYTQRKKQVMMFSATLSKTIRPICKKFMHDKPMEIYVDDETKLRLEGLQQFYDKLTEEAKNRKLVDLLDALEFNQVMIFVKDRDRSEALAALLKEQSFPAMCIHGKLSQEERTNRFKEFKDFKFRILVSTDLMGRGIDVSTVNIVVNYDMPEDSDTYLHRVARAGRFGTKGLAITFVSSAADTEILNDVQSRFEVEIKTLPEEIDMDSYMQNTK